MGTYDTDGSQAGGATAFLGERRLARGGLGAVALAVRAALLREPEAVILTFDDRSGAVIDLDLRGSETEVLARLESRRDGQPVPADAPPRGRGRPKLGVVAREVTLLPRHWEWLAAQSGGASVALRRLVEEARLRDGGESRRRQAKEAAYRFMAAMAGDRPGFEEAARALFADDAGRLAAVTGGWPDDIRAHVLMLAGGETGAARGPAEG